LYILEKRECFVETPWIGVTITRILLLKKKDNFKGFSCTHGARATPSEYLCSRCLQLSVPTCKYLRLFG